MSRDGVHTKRQKATKVTKKGGHWGGTPVSPGGGRRPHPRFTGGRRSRSGNHCAQLLAGPTAPTRLLNAFERLVFPTA
eukprot:scaffold25333_cov64-Phaeocystis_antarctica.AAC.1